MKERKTALFCASAGTPNLGGENAYSLFEVRSNSHWLANKITYKCSLVRLEWETSNLTFK